MAMGGRGWDGRTDGRLEIHPCVLQNIGPLGPLPKKCMTLVLFKFPSHNSAFPYKTMIGQIWYSSTLKVM